MLRPLRPLSTRRDNSFVSMILYIILVFYKKKKIAKKPRRISSRKLGREGTLKVFNHCLGEKACSLNYEDDRRFNRIWNLDFGNASGPRKSGRNRAR